MTEPRETPETFWTRLAGYFVDAKPVVVLLLLLLVGGGVAFAPFPWELPFPRDPIAVDAIPDIGENQQIVFTEWPGHAPQDVEDQITYPLVSTLLGLQGVRTVRSTSMFGFSSIYVIFEDRIDYYESRTRLLEKLASLPRDLLPAEVSPMLGPDATALGQVFWYSLQGRTPDGTIAGGWDLHELRTLQDYTIRPALQAVPGVAEVSSVGGHVAEYQIDVDPEALLAAGVTLDQVARAASAANLDVGARTLEVNGVEYVIRGLGQLEEPDDLLSAVVTVRDGTAIHIADVAHVSLGPASRRGLLDDAGAEAVGGIVVVRYGENPLAVIQRVKAAIEELAPGLPARTLEDGTVSKVTIVPFYDRTGLIYETLGTLSSALWQQLLITILVVLVMLRSLRGSVVVSAILPLGVLFAFVAMKAVGVDANVMALAGIAIAIGTMVDVGIVFAENITGHLDEAASERPSWPARARIVRRAAGEVAPAVLTSVLTTVVSFLPVFALTASEGKLFRPLAWTKTFALIGAFVVALLVVPSLSHVLLRPRRESADAPEGWRAWLRPEHLLDALIVAGVAVVLTMDWEPLGPEAGLVGNLLFVGVSITVVLGGFALFRRAYPRLLSGFMAHKAAFLAMPTALLLLGLTSWKGIEWWIPSFLEGAADRMGLSEVFPGLAEDDEAAFDEGSFLFMPTTTAHASFGEARALLQTMDAAIAQIPEVDRVVGKLGRADSVLDPAPISMFETLVLYGPEYGENEEGERVRLWRDHIRSPADIWQEIVKAARIPGLTGAPVLQPISTRIVMLQSGMRGRVGLKLRGPDLPTLEAFGRRLEAALRGVEALEASTVFAERTVGKPYLELEVDREAAAAYGLQVAAIERTLATAIGGRVVGQALEGRVRRDVRVRFMHEERDDPDDLLRVPVALPSGGTVPLGQVASLRYVRGPQFMRAEDTFLTSYLTFDPAEGVTAVEAVEAARTHLNQLVDSGELEVPAGVSWRFAGTYENQQRASQRLMILVPIALLLVLLLLYFQFRSVAVSLTIFAGVAVAMAGGFTLLWLWGRPGFLDVGDLAQVFQVGPVPLTVKVWVGFIALVGIAVDDGVVMATYLKQRFADPPRSVGEVRAKVLEAGLRRVRPCLMTTATTVIALLPVLTATGRGSDVMRPMALPVVGGMTVELLTLFVVPVLWALRWEIKLRRQNAADRT